MQGRSESRTLQQGAAEEYRLTSTNARSMQTNAVSPEHPCRCPIGCGHMAVALQSTDSIAAVAAEIIGAHTSVLDHEGRLAVKLGNRWRSSETVAVVVVVMVTGGRIHIPRVNIVVHEKSLVHIARGASGWPSRLASSASLIPTHCESSARCASEPCPAQPAASKD